MSIGMMKTNMSDGKYRIKINITGCVQGVGFRPLMYQYATALDLRGYIENTTEGVTIELEGKKSKINEFMELMKNAPPPLAKIDQIKMESTSGQEFTDFQIYESKINGESKTNIPVDVAICDDCLQELNDLKNRRYNYPFTNCMNCGPRFTIIIDVPYDRPMTTMRKFLMCPDCQKEYENPLNRRFHAQPISCPKCGPQLTLISPSGRMKSGEPLMTAIRFLQMGIIMAIKGLGGYHLVCDATNRLAVQSLRNRKHRPEKPLAIMFPNLEIAREHCFISESEEKILTSPESPIVLLRKKKGGGLSPDISPGNDLLGVLLPYTPLHHLLLRPFKALVMTSANFSDEPIISHEIELNKLMDSVIDCALIHDRPIAHKCDDSIVRWMYQKPVILRRARGYVPVPVKLYQSGPSIFSAGAELKSTFCLSKENDAYLSQHLGDLQEYPTIQNYEKEYEEMKKLLEIEPEIVAFDLHPDYWSTRFAKKLEVHTRIAVQHHHAHIVSCMTENKLNEPVIGISFDGTGYGTDGHLWGGEFMIVNLVDFKRVGHIQYHPLPGGERAILEPWRMAVSYLYTIYGNDLFKLNLPLLNMIPENQVNMVIQMMEKNINSPFTSSIGRLFDGIYSFLGFGQRTTYEGQTGLYLESLTDTTIKNFYNYKLISQNDMFQINTQSIFNEIYKDMMDCKPYPVISTKFHNSIVHFSGELCHTLRDKYNINQVVLSGGCFQNKYLLEQLTNNLKTKNFDVFTHSLVPPNDGGISLGQLTIAMSRIGTKEKICV